MKDVLQRSLRKSLLAASPAVSTSPGVPVPVAADDSGRRPLRSILHNTVAVSEVNVADAGNMEEHEADSAGKKKMSRYWAPGHIV